jgi:hypothetical protein
MALRVISASVICLLLVAVYSPTAGAQSSNEHGSGLMQKSDVKDSTGYVTDTTCSGASQRIEVKTSTGTLHLRGPASGGLPIQNPAHLPAGFNSCKSLKGMRVSVQYVPDDSHNQDGTIKSLSLLPAEKVNSAEGPLQPVPSQPSVGDAPAPLVPDTQMTAEGRVEEVTCTGNEILVRVATAGRQFTLHSRNYTRLNFDDDRRSFEDPDFPACTQLKGRVVAIEFVVVEHKAYDGEMRNVEIEK